MTYVAVITGDVVDSTKLHLEARRKLPEVLRSGWAALSEGFRDGAGGIDVFRGDAWQILLTDATKAVDSALLLRLHLRWSMGQANVDTRTAIAVGTVDFVPEDHVSSGDGEAYRMSGEALEQLAGNARSTIVFSSSLAPRCTDLGRAVLRLIDEVAENWTAAQAQAMYGAMRGLTQSEIAQSWEPSPITQQAVAKHLKNGGWEAIETSLSALRQSIVELLDPSKA